MSNIELNIENAWLDCHYDYIKGTPRTYDHPGDSPEVTLNEVYIQDTEVLDLLSESTIEFIKDRIYEYENN